MARNKSRKGMMQCSLKDIFGKLPKGSKMKGDDMSMNKPSRKRKRKTKRKRRMRS